MSYRAYNDFRNAKHLGGNSPSFALWPRAYGVTAWQRCNV